MSETYTVKQVAELLGYSTNSIYSFLKTGRIKGVRVGRGRFRITEEELRRVLHLSKKPVVGQKESAPIAEEKKEEITVPGVDHITYKFLSLRVANLFNWFIGVASAAVGLSLVLFNKYLAREETAFLLAWIFPLQTALTASGLGLLVSELFEKKISAIWQRLFQTVLIISYLVIMLMKFKIGDSGGAAMFGLIFLTLVVTRLGLVEGINPFLIFISGHSLAITFLALYNLEILDLPASLKMLFRQSPIFPAVWFLVALFSVGLLWRWHRKNKLIYWLLMAAFGIGYLVSAFFAVNSLAWCKGFLMLTTGLFALLLPAWETVHLSDHQKRRTILPLLFGILILMVLTIGAIWVMEQNIREYARKEMVNKTALGKSLTEAAVSQLQTIVAGFEHNSELAEMIDKKDSQALIRLLKPLFQSSQYLRRVLVISSSGELLAIYPHQQLTTGNLAFREYFIKALAGEHYFSQGFAARVTDKRWVVVVSGPVRDDEDKIIGVLAASLDLRRLAMKLQEIALAQNEEGFYLIDKNSRYLIHPDERFIGRLVDDVDTVKNEQFDFQGKLSLQNFAQLEKTGWLIGIRAPVEKVVAPTKAVSFILFFLTTVSVFTASVVEVVIKIRQLAG